MDNNFSEIIADKFSSKFLAAYKGLRGGKTGVIKYSPVIFKRWYYSALVSETTLSPSFIYGAGQSVNNGVSAPSVCPDMSGTRLKGFTVKENRYSLNNHPIVNDLRLLVEFCSPDIELDDEDRINPAMADRISKFLSLGDPFYVEYLTALAFGMKLLSKADAIYSNKANISNNYTLFRKLNQEEALKKIVEGAVSLCSKNIGAPFSIPLPFISEKGIISLIKNPIPVDEIFKRIFRPFGVDIEKLWDEYNERNGDYAPEDDHMLSSTFFLGVILDKWFITPFGEYLKIIEPIYCFSYSFVDELEYLQEVIKNGGDPSVALFSPCAFYSFTPFGRRFFALKDNGAHKKRKPVFAVNELLGLLDIDNHSPELDFGDKTIAAKEVYSFKVYMQEDKRLWAVIDAADYNTLHDLHIEIALDFSFNLTGYTIFTDESMNLFSKLSDPKSKIRDRKADGVSLCELDLKKGKKMVYVSSKGKMLDIELIKRVPAAAGQHFPQTVKIGKHMRQGD